MAESARKEDIEKAIKAAEKKAIQVREDAAYNGQHNDGGASQILENIRFYKMGQAGYLPDEWQRWLDMETPLYKEYLKLKKRFEG